MSSLSVARYLVLFFSLSARVLSAQIELPLINPSFEGTPTQGFNAEQIFQLPGWVDCYMNILSSPPDIHSAETRYFNVEHAPQDGNTFLGLVVRDNKTWECVMTKLKAPLYPDQSYRLDLYAGQSPKYYSRTSYPPYQKKFTRPVIIRVWGGHGDSAEEQLLGQTEPVDHIEWRLYSFSFRPPEEFDHILIEAYYIPESKKPYAGHVLIDNLKLYQID